jgi:hypothetical protein
MMNGGKKIFQSKCSPCHGLFAEGAIGPNLTDSHWLHGPQLLDIYRTVREGVPEKGMVAWDRQLRPGELLAVSSYVGSLHGSNPPNAKTPRARLPSANRRPTAPCRRRTTGAGGGSPSPRRDGTPMAATRTRLRPRSGSCRPQPRRQPPDPTQAPRAASIAGAW